MNMVTWIRPKFAALRQSSREGARMPLVHPWNLPELIREVSKPGGGGGGLPLFFFWGGGKGP